MRSATANREIGVNTSTHSVGKGKGVFAVKRKPSVKNISKTPPKISARTQFNHIKEALNEVELIEAGTIQPASLEEVLNEL